MSMKINSLSAFVIVMSITAPAVVNSQSTTDDFTGTVETAVGIYSSVPLGSTISGTYTFDFANANASQSSGTVGSSGTWEALSSGGSFLNKPAITDYVFSSTAQIGSISFATPSPSDYLSQSYVTGYSSGQVLQASNANAYSNNGNVGSEVDIQNINGAFSSAGQPLLLAGGAAFGMIDSDNFTNELGYNLVSLTAVTTVSEPYPAWLVVCGVGVVCALVFKRRRI